MLQTYGDSWEHQTSSKHLVTEWVELIQETILHRNNNNNNFRFQNTNNGRAINLGIGRETMVYL